MTMRPPLGVTKRVLVVEDDDDARALVVTSLKEENFSVIEASDGADALTSVERQPPDLIILDLGLPEVSGLDVLQRVRENHATPIIVLSGRADYSDRVIGLRLGADDYVSKPFDIRELVARVHAVLRRGQPTETGTELDFGELVINLQSRDVFANGHLVDLTAKEFDLLAFMAASPRQVFSREQLLENVWHSSTTWQDASTVNEHIHRLRRKIEPDIGTPRWITTLRGAGYRFSP